MAVLNIHGLCKSFGGNAVLKDLDMAVPEHSVFGFIGRNGAGKTTAMKAVLGLVRPDRGRIEVFGETVCYGDTKTNRYVGYLPDVPEFYSYMTPVEYLALCGKIGGMKRDEIHKQSRRLLELTGILPQANRKIRGFSRGMKQRLGIAQALLHRPGLLICDEPTSALDPVGRQEILDILREIRGMTTVIFSTHILSDVERICDTVGILDQGRLALCGSLEEIKKRRAHNEFFLEFATAEQQMAFADHVKQSQKSGISLEGKGRTLKITAKPGAADSSFFFSLLARKGIVCRRFEQVEPTLERLFTEVVQ